MTKTVTGPHSAPTQSNTTKLQQLIQLLQRPEGALLAELTAATSWQKHSVRGALSGTLKKKHKLNIASTLVEGRGRVYRIKTPAAEHTATVAPVGNNDAGCDREA